MEDSKINVSILESFWNKVFAMLKWKVGIKEDQKFPCISKELNN